MPRYWINMSCDDLEFFLEMGHTIGDLASFGSVALENIQRRYSHFYNDLLSRNIRRFVMP